MRRPGAGGKLQECNGGRGKKVGTCPTEPALVRMDGCADGCLDLLYVLLAEADDP